MQPKYRGNGTPERTGSLSIATRRSGSTWTPIPRRAGHQYRDLRDPQATMGWHDAHQPGGLRMQLEGPTTAGLMYPDSGGDGPVVVLLHGVLMGDSLWNPVVESLGAATAASSRSCRSARTPADARRRRPGASRDGALLMPMENQHRVSRVALRHNRLGLLVARPDIVEWQVRSKPVELRWMADVWLAELAIRSLETGQD